MRTLFASSHSHCGVAFSGVAALGLLTADMSNGCAMKGAHLACKRDLAGGLVRDELQQALQHVGRDGVAALVEEVEVSVRRDGHALSAQSIGRKDKRGQGAALIQNFDEQPSWAGVTSACAR